MGFFSRLCKYKYDPNRYPDSFLVNHPYTVATELKQAQEVIFCFWTGDNEMSEQRAACLESMREQLGVELRLITPHNLEQYILPEAPLHPAYKYLSLVHKSDYLRCYFMHHHGGGYSDIKLHTNSWHKEFNKLNLSDKWVLGYPEVGPRGLGGLQGSIAKDLKRNWRKTLGNGCYIIKPYSPFTFEWYAEQCRRLDYYLKELKLNPGNTLGDNPGYPIAWTNILGDIFHPLCLKYSDRLIASKVIKPSFKNYR